MDHDSLFPLPDAENAKKRAELTPEIIDSWRNFSRTVYQEGALTEKTKQLIAVAVAHVTQCPYCIRTHTRVAMRKGASKKEIMEAVWIAAEMRAGAGYSHSILAMDEMEKVENGTK